MSSEWGTLYTSALIPSAFAHEPLINYGGRRIVTGRATAEADDQELDMQEEAEREEIHGYDKDTPADEKEERGDKVFHSFWRRGTACIFNVLVTDSEAARNRGGGEI